MRWVTRLVLATLLAAAMAAQAILIRPDRDDAEYLELAHRYPSSILLGAPDGEGTLIAPRWVLTAAHMARALEEAKVTSLAIGPGRYAIEKTFVHPDWKKGGHSDLALLLLARPVEDVAPTPIYRGKDEGGKTTVIVGHGYSGKIGEKAVRETWDRKKRASINTVDRVAPRILGLRIKPNDDASDLQGAAAPGDSGGPAFFEMPDGFQVAGVGYATDDANANGIVGDIGDWELYVRVSAFAEWIDGVMNGVAAEALEKAAREAAAIVGDTDRR